VTAAIALLGAWTLSSSEGPTLPLLTEAKAGAIASAGDRPDLARLPIFNQVVMRVRDNYFDPSRVDPQQMLVDSLDYVEKQIPEVMVDGDVKSGEVKVTVGTHAATFPVSDVDTIFKMSLRLSQVMAFVQKHLDPSHDGEALRNLEYALTNGMLSSLDPHSVLLKPEYFKEMKLSTKGEFGGLGFIIQMREGELTVVRVLKGTADNPTPAFQAGIRPKDRILRIADESTVNMDVSEAAERLRGKPGSKIAITIQRKGWAEPKVMVLPRAKIEIESVVSKLLDGNVGYVRLKSFQGNTGRTLQTSIQELRKEAGGEIKGLVLDLRSNPGGLLEQAIQVSDTFLDKGDIVTTVGMNNQLKEVKKATDQGMPALERDLPLVVLVNGASASASEIVAGSLKNLDRAVVIGRTTFGKGSVQVLYDLPDQSALKLTIAQYLTAGDVSIQETGITPDVELIASRVEKDVVSAFAPIKTMREADLERHLANPADLVTGPSSGAQAKKEDPQQKPLFSLRYLRDEIPTQDLLEDEDSDEPELGEEFFEDFQIRFAKGLLTSAPYPKRSQVLGKMGEFVAKRAQEEQKRFDEAIRDLGVDWTLAEAKGRPHLSTRFEPKTGSRARAGDTLEMKVTVKNEGETPVYRLRAWTESESNPLLDRKEFLLGHVAPGATKSWTVPVELPRSLSPRRDPVVLKFEDAAGSQIDDVFAEIDIASLPKPRFAYSWQVVEKGGNSSGLPHPGSKLEPPRDIRNLGKGPSSDTTFASIKNKGNEKIFIEKGRWKVGELAPGASTTARFELELKEGYGEDSMPLQLLILDEKLEEISLEEVKIPVVQKPVVIQALSKRKRARTERVVRSAPRDDAPILASMPQGSVLPATGKVGGWTRVRWAKDRFGFVQDEGLEATTAQATLQDVTFSPGRVPPEIALDVDATLGGIASEGDRFTLRGTASGPGLRDVFVFVNDQKVYFGRAGEEGSLSFTAQFPLKEGANHVVVVAREANDLSSRRTVTVLRRDAEMAKRLPPPEAGPTAP
jgi:carboxyl-terminal processing protease